MAADTNPLGDVMKMMEQFKLPGVDMTAIAEARRKDVEALVQANNAVYESMQSIGRKQFEMMTQAMQAMQEAASGAMGGADAARQTQLARQTFEKTLADMKEIAEMAARSQNEAMALITRRAGEHMQELMSLMRPK